MFGSEQTKGDVVSFNEINEWNKNYIITLINDASIKLGEKLNTKVKTINTKHKTSMVLFYNKCTRVGGLIINECNGCLIKDRIVYEYSINYSKCEPKNYNHNVCGDFLDLYSNYYIVNYYSNFISSI